MTLRTRLLLALAGSGLAILLGSFVARDIAIRYASEASILSSIEARMGSLDRATCEAGLDFDFDGRTRRGDGVGEEELRPRGPWERPMRPRNGGDPEFRRGLRQGGPPAAERGVFPGRFGGPGGARRTHVFFYDGSFTPRGPGAPPFPEPAKAQLQAGKTFVNGRSEGGFFGALATSWTGGACTYALALMPTPPPLASFASLIIGALLLIGAPAMALLLALARPVARLRALAAGVREAAASRYETSVPVTGRDEIAELGHAFNDASAVVRAHLAEVERREKALRDFVAHTTHDVALPLSVLLSHVTTLRQDGAGGSGDSTVSAIAQEAHYIASLLANLEAVSRLESDPALHERHPVDVGALIERVAVRHRGMASSTGVDFNHSVPATPVFVEGDVTLIEQAVNNLVLNAIQYNHEGGHVALVLEATGDQFVLRLSDDGPGVLDHDLARLGEHRFRSEEARARRPGGTGLGLSIARDVARRHDFTLTLGNRAEGGFEALLAGRSGQKKPSEETANS
jgi:signal transduction histidine kinase